MMIRLLNLNRKLLRNNIPAFTFSSLIVNVENDL